MKNITILHKDADSQTIETKTGIRYSIEFYAPNQQFFVTVYKSGENISSYDFFGDVSKSIIDTEYSLYLHSYSYDDVTLDYVKSYIKANVKKYFYDFMINSLVPIYEKRKSKVKNSPKKVKIASSYRIKRNGVNITLYKGDGNKKTDGNVKTLKIMVLPDGLEHNKEEFSEFMDGKSLKGKELRTLVCGDCPFKHNKCYCEKGLMRLGILSSLKSTNTNDKNVYVNDIREIPEGFFKHKDGSDFFVRFGSFAEPMKFMLTEEIEYILKNSSKCVGYSHLPFNIYGKKTKYFMQSVENQQDAISNYHKGLSSFLVIQKDDYNSVKAEFTKHNVRSVSCPASKENNYVNSCSSCGLCQNYKGKNKVVYIIQH